MRPMLKLQAVLEPRSHFSLCNHYPRTQGCSLSCSRLDLIFHFLCGVTGGSYFMFSSGDNCSFAVLPSSPFWHFSFRSCDSGSECLHSWLFHSLAAAPASVRSGESGPSRGRARQPPARCGITFASVRPCKGDHNWNERTNGNLRIINLLKSYAALWSLQVLKIMMHSL